MPESSAISELHKKRKSRLEYLQTTGKVGTPLLIPEHDGKSPDFNDSDLGTITVYEGKAQKLSREDTKYWVEVVYELVDNPAHKSSIPIILESLAFHNLIDIDQAEIFNKWPWGADTTSKTYSLYHVWRESTTGAPRSLARVSAAHANNTFQEKMSAIKEAHKVTTKRFNSKEFDSVPDDQFVAFVGAWAFSHLRGAAKDGKILQSFFDNEGGKAQSRFERVYAGVSGRVSLSFPTFPDNVYEVINTTFSTPSATVRRMLIQATAIAHSHSLTPASFSYESNMLKGLAMISLSQYALPAYNFSIRVAKLLKVEVMDLLREMADELTIDSVDNVMTFFAKYASTAESYAHLSESVKNALGSQNESIYWPISRLIDPNYLKSVGRIDNEQFILTLIYIHDMRVGAQDRILGGNKNFVPPSHGTDAQRAKILAEEIVRTLRPKVDANLLSVSSKRATERLQHEPSSAEAVIEEEHDDLTFMIPEKNN